MTSEISKKEAKELLTKMRKRSTVMMEADQENRRKAMDDMKFVNVPGAQWDSNMRVARGTRPCLEFNKIRVTGKRIINEIRSNRPAGKVRPVEDSDKKTADIYEGLCRNIWNTSDGDSVIDYAAEYQVNAGMGAWRVNTKYASEEVFDQDIVIEAIKNPFCLYCDPAAQDAMKRDAADWLLIDRMSDAAYKARWPKAKVVSFESTEFDDEQEWEDGETVRIAEYWYKEPYSKELLLVDFGDGTPLTLDASEPGVSEIPTLAIKKRRTVQCERILMIIASGEAILEGPVEWAGTQFPFVMVFGEQIVIDGKTHWYGLPRFARDAQQFENVMLTSAYETVAAAPKEYNWATPKQAEGLLASWDEANSKNFHTRLYNPDPLAPGAPGHHPGADVPVALIQMAEIADQQVRDVTGVHEASFGQEAGERSGIALARKQNQAAIVTYNFPDNMAKGVRRTWEIEVDLIPKIYDSTRTLRIIGPDGAEDYAKVNHFVQNPQTGEAEKVNDLATGRYDVSVTTGPGYQTQRMEAAEIYTQMAQAFPPLMQVAGDLIMKSNDLPYSEEIAERMQTLLPPQIQQQLQEGKDMPPEVQQAMAQVQQAMQQVQQQGQLVQQAAQEVQQEKATADKAKADVQTAIANLKTEEARFEAKVAKAQAMLAQKEMQITQTETQNAAGGEREALGTEVTQAVAEIREMAAAFQQQAVQTLAEIMGKQQTQVLVPPPPPRPKIKSAKIVRGPEGTSIVPQYEDDMMPVVQ